MPRFAASLVGILLSHWLIIASASAKDDWISLSDDLKSFRSPTGDWFEAGSVRVDPKDPKKLIGEPGRGILVNGKTGVTENLITSRQWGDVEVSLEFLVPSGSNSGVKLQGAYELQIRDSWGVTDLTGSDCGGIYPRAEFEHNPPKYYHIDKGIAPRVNAAKEPGQWQTLEIIFRAPRFDKKEHKTANARFVKVVLNGKLIHENVEVAHPTGHYWHDPEHATGPLYFQGDHGPAAYRNIRVRPLAERQ